VFSSTCKTVQDLVQIVWFTIHNMELSYRPHVLMFALLTAYHFMTNISIYVYIGHFISPGVKRNL